MVAVQSIERAFAILKVVADQPDGMGVTEVALKVKLPKSTVSRLLLTLESIEAVERSTAPDGFRIGAGIIDLATQASFPRYLITVARPYLLDLAQATSETVTLCLPDGDEAHYLYQVPSQYHLQLQDWSGLRFPLHVVSDGKLFLAYAAPEQVERYLSRPLNPLTKKTVTDPETLRRQLAEIRAAGCAWSQGEYEIGIVGVAAPIFNTGGQVIASVSIGAPAFRFPPDGRREEINRMIIGIARDIGDGL